MAGELYIRDVSELDDEDLFAPEREGRKRLLSVQEHPMLDIHASREARWHQVDVAGTRPMVVFNVLNRLLAASGFSSELVWGRPDRRRGVFRTERPAGCKLERPQMLSASDLDALGLDRPKAEPLMGRWTGSPCHAALIDGSRTCEPWVHGWDAGHPALVAQLFVEWEAVGEERRSYVELHGALVGFGPQAVVMYLLGSHYSELLAPMHEGLQRAKRHVKRINATLERLKPGEPSPPSLSPIREAFEEALADDLDTPSAFLALFDWIREAKAGRYKAGDEDLRRMLWLLGMAKPPAKKAGTGTLTATRGRPRTA